MNSQNAGKTTGKRAGKSRSAPTTVSQAGHASLSRRDRELLDTIKPIVTGFARLFGSNCEIVLHSFEDLGRSVTHIENGHVTGRSIGSPITDLGMEVLKRAETTGEDVLSGYFTKTRDGRAMKSATIMLRNRNNKPIGMVCVNFDLSIPLIDAITPFVPDAASSAPPREHFALTAQELIHDSLREALAHANNESKLSPSERCKKIVSQLHAKKVFDVKGAVDFVADELGVSRYTIYNHIREAKIRGSRESQ